MHSLTHASSKHMAMAFSSLTMASSLRAHIANLTSDPDASTTHWVIIDPHGNKRNVSINIDANTGADAGVKDNTKTIDDDTVFNQMNSKTE